MWSFLRAYPLGPLSGLSIEEDQARSIALTLTGRAGRHGVALDELGRCQQEHAPVIAVAIWAIQCLTTMTRSYFEPHGHEFWIPRPFPEQLLAWRPLALPAMPCQRSHTDHSLNWR